MLPACYCRSSSPAALCAPRWRSFCSFPTGCFGRSAVFANSDSYAVAMAQMTCERCGALLPDDARFCPRCGAPVAAFITQERKVVTILFADLARSTELSAQLDPERFREVMAAFFRSVSTELESLRGRAEKFVGDAVMAVWGAPRSLRRCASGRPGRLCHPRPNRSPRGSPGAPRPPACTGRHQLRTCGHGIGDGRPVPRGRGGGEPGCSAAGSSCSGGDPGGG